MPAPPPQTAAAALDRGFVAARAQALELAALLDRLDRLRAPGEPPDPRVRALLAALPLLTDGRPGRAARMLDLWSDPTREPAAGAVPGAATGAYTPG